MTFAWPHLLWLLLAPAVFLVWELTRHRLAARNAHPKILQAEAGAHSLKLTSSATASPSGSRTHVWLALGIAFSIVALARPQWGRVDQPVFDQSREILIAIDLSKSMLTPDVKPSRLDRAKLLTQSLLEKLSGERVGLIVFSGTAFLQSPLSADYEILREFLPALNPAFLPEGGTNYDALLDTALDAFTSDAAADRFLIVLSDGEATDEHWRDRLPDLKKRGIRVLALGVGTAAGAMIPDEAGGFVKDERGAVVMSKLESGTLKALADASGGAYRDASGWVDLADLLNATVEAGRKGKFLDKNTVRHVERFQWPLALALWFFFVSFCYEFPVRPKPRDLKLGGATPPAAKKPSAAAATTTAVSAIALLLAFAASSPRLRAADEPPAPPVSATALSKIVGRLAAAAPESRSARDWAELAQETVTWGSKLQSAQQPVPAGPIHDALGAVDLGSKLDAKTADWPKLRSQLEELLKQSEEQKQKQQQQQDKDKQQSKDQQQKQQDQQQKQNQQDQNQSGSPKDQQNQQQQKQDASQKQQPQNPSDQQKKSSDQQQQQGSPSKPPQKDGAKPQSAFGDMKDQAPPPPKPSQEMQKVGGVPPKKNADQPPVDPALALPMQKLEQLRNQDSPAELFQMMDADQHPAPSPSNKKDW